MIEISLKLKEIFMISSNHGDKIMITVGRSPVETRHKVPLTQEDVKKLAAEIQPVLEPYVVKRLSDWLLFINRKLNVIRI